MRGEVGADQQLVLVLRRASGRVQARLPSRSTATPSLASRRCGCSLAQSTTSTCAGIDSSTSGGSMTTSWTSAQPSTSRGQPTWASDSSSGPSGSGSCSTGVSASDGTTDRVEAELRGELGLANDQVSGAGQGEQLRALVPAGVADVPLDLDQDLLQQLRHGDHPVRSDDSSRAAAPPGTPARSR